MFNVAQSCFIDKEVVQGAPVAFLTSADLYFKSKPVEGKSSYGMNKPGVFVNVCSIVDGKPDLNTIDYRTFSRVEFDNINTLWNWDIFKYYEIMGDMSLCHFEMRLFMKYGLIDKFSISE